MLHYMNATKMHGRFTFPFGRAEPKTKKEKLSYKNLKKELRTEFCKIFDKPPCAYYCIQYRLD